MIIRTFFQFINIITLQTLQLHHAYMDKSIKKGSIVIQNHSINIRNKEYCKWIDDSYFLVKNHIILKVNFLDSKKTFEFIKKKWKKN